MDPGELTRSTRCLKAERDCVIFATKSAHIEKRAHPRYAIHDPVCITVMPHPADGSVGTTFCAKAEDLSVSGLRFVASTGFEKGQILNLLVVRGCAFRGFSFTGRVVWVRQDTDTARCSVGVEFVDVPEPARVAWQEMIERTQRTTRQPAT
jgi:c-di-GMP-binding flagellar brake protein YcgR